ncbi:LOW QUALITY PROTEIN: zinc finger protein schnurri [Aphomia sociella]
MSQELEQQTIHYPMTGQTITGTMPLTQEKRLDTNFSNNNDQSYLHKKFKKMASTITVFPNNQIKGGETRHKETDVVHSDCNTSISNGSIAAAHPEIEKIKVKLNKNDTDVQDVEKNVQNIYNNENIRLSNVNNNVQVTGQTSYTEEFSNKTENNENDFIRDAYNGGIGGRYICPYCKLSCAKPSVLQKHIRAHTNERPYPCVPCGFAFKTKSNLYKHRRSRTHALRLQGSDVSAVINEDDLSGGSESDTSLPATSISDAGSDSSVARHEHYKFIDITPLEFTDYAQQSTNLSYDNAKSKSIYKPKFRGASYQEIDEKDKSKKTMSPNADFLTEHISKIISDNEAIVDVIDTPLQKKYGKIKQIAESKQLLNDCIENKPEASPLNLTKNSNDIENTFRKRSHSESFTHIDQKHPLNPERSIIKDLLLKTKTNCLSSIAGEMIEGLGPLFVCPLCQIIYRSADNLEIHRLYYCKGNNVGSNSNAHTNSSHKDVKVARTDNIFVRSNSINVRLPETQLNSFSKSSALRNKPDHLNITKPESNDVAAPLPSPGPLLGSTRLVDTRTPEYHRKTENLKIKPDSPKRRCDSRSDAYSPRLTENISPRTDMYTQSKIRCIDGNSVALRYLEEMSQHMRSNSTSLQMFGGEVKILDHAGGTTTLRIEPSKNQLSPILVQQNLSPSKIGNETEASSVVVRSGLHSGGTMVHNPPTPKEIISTPQPQTPRITISTASSNLPNIHGITHFQFPPLSAITAFNPLTLPPLSPSSSPSGATTILHGGKLIPHVPGIPGPNTPGIFVDNSVLQVTSAVHGDISRNLTKSPRDDLHVNSVQPVKGTSSKYDSLRNARSPIIRTGSLEIEKNDSTNNDISNYATSVPVVKIKNVDDQQTSSKLFSPGKCLMVRQEGAIKRSSDSLPRTPVLKESNYPSNKLKVKDRILSTSVGKNIEIKIDNDIKNYNFENLITKVEIINKQIPSSSEVQKNTNAQETSIVAISNERSETSYFQKNVISKSSTEERKPKFLRPSTLPLKPGTFTPKRHHGITPNSNTMPLVSPETPRPAKAYGQLYLNGNAYTYLGLKCSTKVFYCTINRPQPTYVPNQHFLSMYSNWQLLSELTPDPLGLSASSTMSLYDSRHRPQNVAVAVVKQDLILTHSSKWNINSKENKQTIASVDCKKSEENKLQVFDNTLTPKKEYGGFESNEEYTYVRGRGRGRYVCSECGIRCKKPSTKKHIRTHTDVRPYTCTHCAFSFKTKGNLTKHMKSKAHYKKCCELGINPNEGNDIEGGEMNQCSGETDDDTESEGDEGNEGETESSDTEVCKSRLPEHEAAHCLLSLGSSRPTTSATPGLITSARPSTYPYTPTGVENMTDISSEKLLPVSSVDSGIDVENEPMDLSKGDLKSVPNITEIPTARESSVLASLASNTAKLPQHQSQWANGEPMLHTYLTERALLDTKIKQSQLTCSLSKLRKVDIEQSGFKESNNTSDNNTKIVTSIRNPITTPSISPNHVSHLKITTANEKDNLPTVSTPSIHIDDNTGRVKDSALSMNTESKIRTSNQTNAENAKHVVSEYLKQARMNLNLAKLQEDPHNQSDNSSDDSNNTKINAEDNIQNQENSNKVEADSVKLSAVEHDPVARKVVIGVGGVAFKVSKGKEFESTSSFPPGRLMEDGRRVCDFCNKTFTKPSQLRLHLNIHYMERPFRCSVCAVSFRTRGHLQKHERSGSHHNKVSMTSTFGAATSFNPRPFRCSDCNIAFRIHGHLAKHLRSKMHVMRLECLFKLPFGTFTEIERAGVSLTDIDTTDCASSLASLQSLAQKLHEKDPTKLEYREPNGMVVTSLPVGRESSEDEDTALVGEKICDSEKDSEMKTIESSENHDKDTRVNYSATDN